MKGIILHSDLNCFYASVEMNEHPELKGRRVAVCGSAADRHGIVLTASYPAKKYGVKTGMAIWQARQCCPDLIIVEPHYDLYLKYSRTVRAIYQRFSNDVEPYGMDECWINLPWSNDVETEGKAIAENIRKTVYEETGLTVSIGVSFSKVIAKLGSDMKKPDAVTVIDRRDFHRLVWPLPVGDMLYVGRSTVRKLAKLNVFTIGDLAGMPIQVLQQHLGKNGLMLSAFARGEDQAPVCPSDYIPDIKSVGHGATCVRDLENNYEVWRVLYELAQDVGHRLRQHGLRAGIAVLHIRTTTLQCMSFQCGMPWPTQSPFELASAAFSLFQAHYHWDENVRALTVCGTGTEDERAPVQLDLFNNFAAHEKRKALDDTVDALRIRFGSSIIRNASLIGAPLNMAQDRCETVLMPGLMYR